jgi:hypothetical protein
MKRFVGGLVLVAAALVIATPAVAQLGGQPVYAIPKGTGVTVNADFGVGIDPGSYNTGAARVSLGLPMVAFQAGFEPEMLDAAENQIMGGAAVTLMPMPVALRIQASVAYGLDSKNMVVPAGVVIGFNVPSPSLSVEPWVYPSVRISMPDVGDTEFGFGGSAGVSIGLPGGLGGHVALDYAKYPDVDAIITGGIGVHYAIRLPGAM